MALRLSTRRMKHLFTQGSNPDPGVSWWYFPDAKLGLRAPQAPTCNIHHVPKTWKLRGSGLWGPEQTDVLKLILWNRKRQWRPQREVPTIEEQQDHYVLEFAIIWFTAGNVFIMGPVLWWAKKYRMAHDHYPWGPPRLDGSKGPGGFVWFWE